MTHLVTLAHPVAFGPDAEGVLISAEAVNVKWITLDFKTGQANCECTLPNRPDVAFARSVSFDPSNASVETLSTSLAAELEATIPPAAEAEP